MSELHLASPCVRNCCLDENDICLGCNRSLDEIKNWLSMTNSEKARVFIRCHEREVARSGKHNELRD